MAQKDFESQKAKKFQLFSKLKLMNIFPGEWESIYQGDGIEFANIKPFEPGDDVRELDLHALAQAQEELIIQRTVESQMVVYVWADFSGSMQRFEEMFFPSKPEIRDIAIGLILSSAVKIYCPVGFYPFGLKEGRIFPPKIGEGYCWEIINWLVEEDGLIQNFTSSGVETALSAIIRLARPRNIVFFISDFQQKVFEGNFAALLRKTVSKFDFIPVIIKDPLERYGELSRSARIMVQSSDAMGKTQEVYLAPQVLREIQNISEAHLLHLDESFRQLGIEKVVLDSPSIDDCHKTLSNFFQARRRTTTR